MKTRRILLFLLAVAMLFTASCRQAPGGGDGSTEPGEPEQPAPRQHIALRLSGDGYYVDGTVYFFNNFVRAIDCDADDFNIYIPCFDPVCDHMDRSKCVLRTAYTWKNSLAAFMYKGELAIINFSRIDTCLAMPYSNTKINLLCEDFVSLLESDPNAYDAAYNEWNTSASRAQYSDQLIYGDHLYYVKLQSGIWTQYRIPLTGGKPERVFEEDNIIIKTIINDRFYGIRYDNDDPDPDNPWEVTLDRDNVHYFRSDMNYENIEPLPSILSFFQMQGEQVYGITYKTIFDADEDYIYVASNRKLWAVSDENINEEPILIADMSSFFSDSNSLMDSGWRPYEPVCCHDGVIYYVIRSDRQHKEIYDYYSYSVTNKKTSMSWYGKATLLRLDIKTGEYKTIDITDNDHMINELIYADDTTVYAMGAYVHDNGLTIRSTPMRLKLDTGSYDVILPDEFLELSATIPKE